MASLEEMATRGVSKFKAKLPSMSDSYDKSVPRAKANFAKQPFGPIAIAHYNNAMDTYAPPDYRSIMAADDKAARWRERWIESMGR